MAKASSQAVAAAVLKATMARLSAVARKTKALQGAALDAVRERVAARSGTRTHRLAIRRGVERGFSESHLRESAPTSVQPGSTLSLYDAVAANLTALGQSAVRYRQLRDVLARLLAAKSAAVRAIAANFGPNLLKSARSILGEPAPGKVRYVDAETYVAWMLHIAGLSAEEDLVAHPRFRAVLKEVAEDVRLGKDIPDELADVVFEEEPLVVRRVRAPDTSGRIGQPYVDIQLLFRGRKPGSREFVYFAPLRAQSKLGNVADLFSSFEEGAEVIGQLDLDELRWGTGPLDVNGARIPPDRVFEPKGGQRVVAASTRVPTAAQRATLGPASKVEFIRHQHTAGDYVETGRAVMAAFGIRRKAK